MYRKLKQGFVDKIPSARTYCPFSASFDLQCTSHGKGSSINNVTVVGGRGQEFCDNSTKASVIKSLTIGGRGVKNVQNCATSFKDDPKVGNPLISYNIDSWCRKVQWETFWIKIIEKTPVSQNFLVSFQFFRHINRHFHPSSFSFFNKRI